MALTLDPTSIAMSFVNTGAKADCRVGKKRALLHCTVGADLTAGDTSPPKDVVKDNAVKIEARAFIASTANEFDVGDMQFGMVQTTEISFYDFTYAGRRSSEGSCVANMKQGFGTNPCLDVRQKALPAIDSFIFDASTIDRVTGARPGFNVLCNFGDHPNQSIPYRFQNGRTGASNFLALAARAQKFSVFFLTRASATATPVVLGRLDWAVAWLVEFGWTMRKQVPTPSANVRRAEFIPGFFTRTVPASDPTASIAVARRLPSARKQDDDAITAIWTNHRQPHLTQSTAWPAGFRTDFFT